MDSKIPAAQHRAEARVLATGHRVRMTLGARKWARPDLDWRPSGYQPDAPTRLSYGPVGSRKLVTRLKRSPSGRRNHRFERVRGPINAVGSILGIPRRTSSLPQ